MIYRGVTYRIEPNIRPSEVPVQPVAYRLMYRGIASNAYWHLCSCC
ncbi:MAG: DUF4278 domain-containing protein [Microcoleus sp. SIO2G3]|nr:DUF4278 domain-containing protein [Microcoleus sp. SIO2G3]